MVDPQAVEDSISRARDGRPSSPRPESETPSPRGKYMRTEESKRRTSESVKAANRKRKGEPEKPTPAAAPEPPSPAEIAAYGLLGGTLWKLVGGMIGLRPLNDKPLPGEELSERDMLGAALAPIGKKYLPTLDRWAEEVNAVVVVMILWERTRIPKEVEPEPFTEEGAKQDEMARPEPSDFSYSPR